MHAEQYSQNDQQPEKKIEHYPHIDSSVKQSQCSAHSFHTVKHETKCQLTISHMEELKPILVWQSERI
jgi:hypothetical protein